MLFIKQQSKTEAKGQILMSFLLVRPGISQWVIKLSLENHSAVPCNYSQPHKNQWRWEWKRAAILEKNKLGTLIAGGNRMGNEQLDPSPQFGPFRSVRSNFPPELSASLAVYIHRGGLSTGSLPARCSATIPRYCPVRVQTPAAAVSW